ncbi:MAG: pilin, partial [Candidatus Pacebacteria bacterium]|nr:pilin [Candidatus Paceibacterota bacterium]
MIFVIILSSFSVSHIDAAGACKELANGTYTYTGNSISLYSSLAACLDAHSGAETVPYSSGSTGIDSGHSGNDSNNAVAGSGVSIKLANPLGTVDTIPEFVKAVLDIVMKVGVPLVALAIIYTGYLFIAAQGKPEELKKAKDALVYVFVGSMILLGAYVIAEAIIGTVNAIRGK